MKKHFLGKIMLLVQIVALKKRFITQVFSPDSSPQQNLLRKRSSDIPPNFRSITFQTTSGCCLLLDFMISFLKCNKYFLVF